MEKNIKVAENTYWVGYVDKRLVPFHRLTLEKGTTYNSYLIMADKPTIIDTVDISFGKVFVEGLQEYINLDKIKYIVINHVEPDHSGGLPLLASKAKDAVIVTTELAAEELKNMYRLHNREFLIVRDGDELDIGGKTLRFFETPYLHTEETMITYCVEDRMLYTCDIFSTHVATYDLFNDLAADDIIPDFEGYYKLIMHPHRPYVQNMIDKIKELKIDVIAPSHGYILRDNPRGYIEIYNNMSRPNKNDKKALLIYSTLTGNTKKLAEKLSLGLEDKGITTEIINVSKDFDLDRVKDSIKGADALLFGSSTRYGDMVGRIEEVLKEVKDMNLQNKVGAAFGSYGWSGEAVEVINDYLSETNIKLLNSSYMIKATGMTDISLPVRVKFNPDGEEEKIISTAHAIGDSIIG